MYKRQIAYLAMIGIKFFFNLEHELSEQIFIISLLFLVCFKQVIFEVLQKINFFLDEGSSYIKYSVECLIEQSNQKNQNYSA